jgi:hypothetical protein
MLTITSPREDHLSPDYSPTLAASEAQQHLQSCENLLTDRPDVLQAIAFHESRLLELRAKLPTAIKLFYRYRCKPIKTGGRINRNSRTLENQRLNAMPRVSSDTYGSKSSNRCPCRDKALETGSPSLSILPCKGFSSNRMESAPR